MSIQEYVCPIHNKQEVFIRKIDVPAVMCCRYCGKPMPHIMSLPAPPKITETWDDAANRCRVNCYDQAKEQLRNLSNENQEHNDDKPLKITEEMLQVTAREIDKGNKKPDDPMAAPKRANRIAKKNRKPKQES